MSYQEWCNVLIVTQYLWPGIFDIKLKYFFKGTIVDGPLRKTKYYDISNFKKGKAHMYGCSLVAKLSQKNIFVQKYLCFLQNIYYLLNKMFLY